MVFCNRESLLDKSFYTAQAKFYKNSAPKTCLEFGVFEGNTYGWMLKQIQSRYEDNILIGFDSWQGLPEETSGVWIPDRHIKGAYSSTKEKVLKILSENNAADDPRFRLVDGFFSDTLTKELQDSIQSLIFVNIDVDLHSSSMEVLKFITPLLQPGTVIYWDDWKDPVDKYEGKWGEHLAWEQWSASHPGLVANITMNNAYNQVCMEVISNEYKK